MREHFHFRSGPPLGCSIVQNESLYHATSISLIVTSLQLEAMRRACKIGTNRKRAAGTKAVPPAVDGFAL
jgi:hypothetical protein